MKFFTKRIEQTTDDKLLLLNVQAQELGYTLIETEQFITASTYFKELDTMLQEKIHEVGKCNRDRINEIPLKDLKYELSLTLAHSSTLLRALTVLASNESLQEQAYAVAVTNLVTDTIHNGPLYVNGKTHETLSDLDHKMQIATIIHDYICLIEILRKHLENLPTSKLRSDMFIYYDVYFLEVIKGQSYVKGEKSFVG